MDTRVAVVTVRVADPLTPLKYAVIVVVPALRPVASPELLINAELATDEFQLAWAVKSCVLLSVKTPVAVNCTFPLIPTTVVTGVTTIEVRVAGVTVSAADADSE